LSSNSSKLPRALRAVVNFVPVVLLRQLRQPPIIIGGCARSGTTLMLSILSSSPRIFAFPRETGLFCPTVYRGRRRASDMNAPFSRYRFYRHLLYQNIPRSARRWCEKTPKNVLQFGRILDHFDGRVRLIHMVRDGRDVVTSQHPRDPSKYWVAPQRWVEEVRAGLAWEEHESVLTVRYEDLVADVHGQLSRLEEFLDEDLRGLADDWQDRAAVRLSVAWFDEVQATHSRSIGRWKDPRHRAVVEQLMALPEAGELLERLGYEATLAELPSASSSREL
jgi:hypothetical protein